MIWMISLWSPRNNWQLFSARVFQQQAYDLWNWHDCFDCDNQNSIITLLTPWTNLDYSVWGLQCIWCLFKFTKVFLLRPSLPHIRPISPHLAFGQWPRLTGLRPCTKSCFLAIFHFIMGNLHSNCQSLWKVLKLHIFNQKFAKTKEISLNVSQVAPKTPT